MPRVVVDEDGGPSQLGHIDPSLLPDGKVVDQFEAPIATEIGEVPDLVDLASILDPYAPAPTLVPPNDQEGHHNGTN